MRTMTKEKIARRIGVYYLGKRIIVGGLLFSTFALLLGVIGVVISGEDFWAGVGCISYGILLFFVILSMKFPIGVYSIHDSLAKYDICQMIDYVCDLNCKYNERCDCLSVVKRTAYNKVESIRNWGNTDKEEIAYNNGWKAISAYFDNSDLLHLDFENFKEYLNKLKEQIKKRQIDNDVLDEIQSRQQFNALEAGIEPFSRERLIYYVCVVALIVLIGLKAWIINFHIDQKSNWFINNFTELGSDIVALVFAGFAIRNTYLTLKNNSMVTSRISCKGK